MSDKKLTLRINRSKIATVLIYSVVVLVILNIIGLFLRFGFGYEYAKGFVPKFDFDYENNVPTYFSSVLLLIVSCLTYWISMAAKHAGTRYARHWWFLSIIFLFLSLDETASLHELLVGPLRDAFNLSGIFYFSWVVVGIIAVILIGVLYIKFLFGLPSTTRNGVILAGALYLGGVIVLELAGGYYASANLHIEL